MRILFTIVYFFLDVRDPFAWRIKPENYSDNPRVVKRIEYYKMHQETFEDRLISSCYKFLISQKQSLVTYHRELDFDLDDVCGSNNDYIQLIEANYFSLVFDFDKTLLKKLFEGLPNEGEIPIDPKDYTPMESLLPPLHEDRPCMNAMNLGVTFVIFLSTMSAIRDKQLTLGKHLLSEDFTNIFF